MHSGKENTDQDLTKNQHLPEDEQEDGQLQTKGKKLNKRLRLYQNSNIIEDVGNAHDCDDDDRK